MEAVKSADLARFSWGASVLYTSCTASHNARLASRRSTMHRGLSEVWTESDRQRMLQHQTASTRQHDNYGSCICAGCCNRCLFFCLHSPRFFSPAQHAGRCNIHRPCEQAAVADIYHLAYTLLPDGTVFTSIAQTVRSAFGTLIGTYITPLTCYVHIPRSY